jgi:hypothetical protein
MLFLLRKDSSMRRLVSLAAVSALGMSFLIGCSQPRPMGMAPPMNQNQGYAAPQQGMGGQNPGYAAPQQGMGGSVAGNAAGGSVYQWQDVPVNQDVPITRATFDQGGYQIFAQSGETIVVPFANNNMYVMKFGRTNGQAYFRNEGGVPTLYLRPGDGLENAAAQGARWYPIPQDYAYSRPMYVALAPTWNDYVGMGWYPGMNYYGGMWGYSPYNHFAWMPGWYISVGGRRYSDYNSYHTYYTSTPGYFRSRVVYNNYNTARGSAGRTFGSTGSFSSRPVGSPGGFGSGRPTGAFGGSAPGSTGSFGNRNPGATGRTFGGGSTGISAPSRPSGGSSFGGGSTGYSAPSRPARDSSFGGGSRPSGGSSFGGGGGRSFGGGRRR